MSRRRNKIFEDVEIIDIGAKGKAIGREPGGQVMLVENAVPGDIVDVRTLRKRKGMYIAIPENYKVYSADRVDPVCAHFGTCGGCKWQHFDYPAQLRFKEKAVRDALQRIAGIENPNIEPIVASPDIFSYRNKLEFTFTDQRWITEEEIKSEEIIDRRGVGFHVPGSFARVVDVEKCHLQPDPSNAIRNFVRNYCFEQNITFQNIMTREGQMRNMIVRTNDEGGCMVTLIFLEENRDTQNALLDALNTQFPQITSLWYCINSKANDSYFDLDFVHHAGDKYLVLNLGDVAYHLGPKSFFQTNRGQAKQLFDIAVAFAELKPDQLVFDLYTGIGSIALYIASRVRHVVGIEEVAAAIDDARRNAQLNGLTNTDFFVGDVREVIARQEVKAYGRPDVVITDPPRAGMHESVVHSLLELAPEKIVYISCNPSTQARDIALLDKHYIMQVARPVDMFPHTSHIENVALLLKKQ